MPSLILTIIDNKLLYAGMSKKCFSYRLLDFLLLGDKESHPAWGHVNLLKFLFKINTEMVVDASLYYCWLYQGIQNDIKGV